MIAFAEAFLDRSAGLELGSFSDVTRFDLEDAGAAKRLVATLRNGSSTGLAEAHKFAGFLDEAGELTSILLVNNGLHIEIQMDRDHPVGKVHPAGVKDVLLEAAITTIQDCEDSVSAVDVEDKLEVDRNWTGIMKGTLEATFEKNARWITRSLNPDKTFTDPHGRILTLPGRSLLLVRHVGLHMYTDAVTTQDHQEIPEGFLDAMVTTLAALHDLKQGKGRYRNSRTGSIYIVKPKLHGPEEVEATVELFERVENSLGLEKTLSKSGLWTRASHHRESERSHTRCERAGRVYQYGFSGPDRRRTPHQHEAGSHAAQNGNQEPTLDECLRRLERGCRH